MMDISKAVCPECEQAMHLKRAVCPSCSMAMEGDFEISVLARLPVTDQAFVMAFVRHHGSLKKMEQLFEISYPTVKNRLNAIAARLDGGFTVADDGPTNDEASLFVLEQLGRGEIDVDAALEKLG